MLQKTDAQQAFNTDRQVATFAREVIGLNQCRQYGRGYHNLYLGQKALLSRLFGGRSTPRREKPLCRMEVTLKGSRAEAAQNQKINERQWGR